MKYKCTHFIILFDIIITSYIASIYDDHFALKITCIIVAISVQPHPSKNGVGWGITKGVLCIGEGRKFRLYLSENGFLTGNCLTWSDRFSARAHQIWPCETT